MADHAQPTDDCLGEHLVRRVGGKLVGCCYTGSADEKLYVITDVPTNDVERLTDEVIDFLGPIAKRNPNMTGSVVMDSETHFCWVSISLSQNDKCNSARVGVTRIAY